MSFGKAILVLGDLPMIGGFIVFLVGIIVPGLAVLPFTLLLMVFDPETWMGIGTTIVGACVFLAVGIAWLRYLEGTHGVLICLPIPFISIRVLWVIYALPIIMVCFLVFL